MKKVMSLFKNTVTNNSQLTLNKNNGLPSLTKQFFWRWKILKDIFLKQL